MIALFPGSFDPFTYGHIDVAERVCAIADRLIIGVGVNPAKRGLIAPEERVALIREATAHLGGVEVVLLQGSTMDEASVFNREIGGVDTWWLPTRPDLAHVSSSAVRELVGLKKDISRYVPPAIERFLTDNRS